ncbi:alpha-L-fucosidase [Carboxylicivirga caseinilyticus]|uniref:alpha-L-fucosidase n=1 Tax=Carboxylicivirga caseinilyticus TaxID=3417572 RepID=UPI003D331B10|nr:alpha-L-fucosidase [Marinilabiliaceae bacterium A049]
MKKSIILLLSILITTIAVAQKETTEAYNERMEWFREARLGIFIHWGLYSEGTTSESWAMYHKSISWSDYMEGKASVFTAENYHPEEWAALFKKVGADYVVMTSKHHDGFALWDTKYSKINAKDWSAAKRDVYTPYVDAVRKAGMKVGVYYSLCDWSHPDYSPINFPRPEKKLRKLYPYPKMQTYWTKWSRFQQFNLNQMKELFDRYQPDLIWFDGDWEHKADEWPSRVIKDSLLTWNPNIVVNSRLNSYGDYNTPEQDPPIKTPERPWELCLTMNESWGYQKDDNDYKSPKFLIETFVRSVAKGGNLLLDVGPKADGTIEQRQIDLLEEIGAWYHIHEEAVRYGQPGIPYGHFDGETTLSADGKSIYLFCMGKFNQMLTLRGIKGEVQNITMLHNKLDVPFKIQDSTPWNDIPGIIVMDVSQAEDARYVSVIKVEFKEPFSLYRGIGHGVELND